MGLSVYITASLLLLAGTLVVTGWWRFTFIMFAIRSSRMTVRRLGLSVSSPDDVVRVDTILRSFAGGFNSMITSPKLLRSQNYCDSLSSLYQPFAQEGTAMGYTLRHLFRYAPEDFERLVVKPRPEYRYLYYVGLGFWWGMRNHAPARVERLADRLDPLHRYLCFDGYGFKHAFFDYPKNPQILHRLDGLKGYARNAAYHGVGRAFFFLYMSKPEVMIEHMRKLGTYAADAAAGVGLASVFVNSDRLEAAQTLAAEMPPEWQGDFHLGMCFAAKARSLNDLDRFQGDISRLASGAQDAVYASIRECDRIELQIRADAPGADGYRRWRGRVAAWMADNIEYPMTGVKESERELHTERPAPGRKREVQR